MSEVNFSAPEFDKVFKRILGKNTKDGYFQLRSLNKNFQSKFEDTIETATVNFPQQLQSLTDSKFSEQIRVVNVSIPDNLPQLDELSLASQNYFPNIKKVNVLFIQTDENEVQEKQIRIFEPINFRGIYVVCNSQRDIEINGRFDVTITDSNFSRANLQLTDSNNISVKNSTFSFSQHNGLRCAVCGLGWANWINSIKMENVMFQNCLNIGVYLLKCRNINIVGLRAENCGVGVLFQFVNGLNMINSNVKNCREGITFLASNNLKMQDCIVSGCEQTGIIVKRSIVRYSRVKVEKKGDNSEDVFVDDANDGSKFMEIL